VEAKKKQISLNDLKVGQSGVVADILGGHRLARRLEAMGVRKGKKINKVSGAFLWGPVTFKVGHTQISIGHGMANKVMVEISA